MDNFDKVALFELHVNRDEYRFDEALGELNPRDLRRLRNAAYSFIRHIDDTIAARKDIDESKVEELIKVGFDRARAERNIEDADRIGRIMALMHKGEGASDV
jgi:hypothetical protein